MSWHPAGRSESGKLADFLQIDEWRHVSLSSRILAAGEKPRFGQVADGRLWIRDGINEMKGTVFLSRFGVVLPSFIPEQMEDGDRIFLRRLLLSRRDRLFSIIGMEPVVRVLESCIGASPRDAEAYRMLVREGDPGEEIPDRMESERAVAQGALKILKAKPSDLEKLWPLEKAYQLEEVLRDGSRLNERLSRRHFLETLKKQMVFYAARNGRPVAKAGTNARGWNRDQIGGVFVVPEFRCQGIGAVVMVRLLQEIRRQGKRPCLFVKESNTAALALYRKLRFSDRGAFRICYWD